MTQEQQKTVEENMGLVGKVIKDKVHGLGQPGIPDYDDLFQTGCIGLIKAAMTDKGGCFSTYAYRLIWNEICDELIKNTRSMLKEQPIDTLDALTETACDDLTQFEIQNIRHALNCAKKNASDSVVKGIRCLELMVQGYNSQEIGAIFGTASGTVRMWMSRARKYLKGFPELQQFAYSEAVR